MQLKTAGDKIQEKLNTLRILPIQNQKVYKVASIVYCKVHLLWLIAKQFASRLF